MASVISASSSDLGAGFLWERAIEKLRRLLDPQIFAAWIDPLSVVQGDESNSENLCFQILSPNKFALEHIKSNYAELIFSTLQTLAPEKKMSLSFEAGHPVRKTNGHTQSKRVETASSASPTPPLSPEKKAQLEILTRKREARSRRGSFGPSNLNPKYEFSNFIVGACNQFAHAVSRHVSEHPGTSYNPLFIYGGVGLGKTHLVNAIGNAARQQGKNALLISSEYFVNELIASLRSNRMPQFKDKFRSVDVLIVDDIQFIIGKERTQEEFFHTFNALHQKHSQIVITSDKVPQQLTGLEDRLRTRFASGVSADLQAPDFETRVAILQKKASAERFELPSEVAELLAQRITSNIRELEGALNKLQALSSLNNEPITRGLAENTLSMFSPTKAYEITVELIQKTVAEYYRSTLKDLVGKRRTKTVALPRQVAMYLCRKHTINSYPEIGTLFGGRDHSTVIHAKRLIEERLREDKQLKTDIASIEHRLTKS